MRALWTAVQCPYDGRLNSINMSESNGETLCNSAQGLGHRRGIVFQLVNADREAVSFGTSRFVVSM